MRDKLTCDYFAESNLQVVWKTAVDGVPAIASALRETNPQPIDQEPVQVLHWSLTLAGQGTRGSLTVCEAAYTVSTVPERHQGGNVRHAVGGPLDRPSVRP